MHAFGTRYGQNIVYPTLFEQRVGSLTRGALGFSVLRFWLFFRSVFRFLCQKISVLVFIAVCEFFAF